MHMTATREQNILRIQGRLHRIGDSVFIPALKCNGTILRFLSEFVEIQPHDYGTPIRRFPKNLQACSGINHCVQLTLSLEGISTRYIEVLNKGTFPVAWRKEYSRPYFESKGYQQNNKTNVHDRVTEYLQ